MSENSDVVTREMLYGFRHEFVIAAIHTGKINKSLRGVFAAETESTRYLVIGKTCFDTFDKLDDALARYNEL
jgi:hypothetical protein